MPISNIIQPAFLPVSENLRLRKFDGIYDFALRWYQDLELVWLVDGKREPYTMEKLSRMYRYLDRQGELYFIEALTDGVWNPIGDVTFWQEDMPIVIADAAYRGKGIGKAVVAALIQRGRDLGFDILYVEEIYDWNTSSRKCFEHSGFRPYQKTEKGSRFFIKL